MKLLRLAKFTVGAAVAAVGLAGNVAPAAEFELQTLKQSDASFSQLAVDEPATPSIHEVRNWRTFADAQSGLPTGWYAGAELFFARASVNASAPFAVGSGFTSGNSINIVTQNYAFDYQASPRVTLGWRSAETGDAVQFTYWHYDNTANLGYTVTDDSHAFIPLSGIDDNGSSPFFNIGDTISSRWIMNFNVYDVEYFKSLAFAGGRWLVTGSAGVRIADINQSVSTTAVGTPIDGVFGEYMNGKSLGFTGAGPRLTLEGRRNLGSWFSLYGRGGYSILVGGAQTSAYSQFVNSNQSINVTNNSTGTVAVADIELGASWRATDSLLLSLGYQFQSWQGLDRNIGQNVLIPGSDFISFDGFVARLAFSY